MKHLQLFESFTPISENLKYHVDNNIPVLENVFRPHSEAFYNLIKEARELFDDGKIGVSEHDKHLFETTDLGYFGVYEGEIIPLDLPIENIEEINEAEYKGKKVNLNSPFKTSGKLNKFAVYVKEPSGDIKMVKFGDPNNKPETKKNFRVRHKCDTKNDKTKSVYWACNILKYRKKLGIKS
jgi:hypothetical protein